MFIGHFAPAFAARAASSKSPGLGTLFVAAQLVDWAFYLFVLAGVEHMEIAPGFTVMKPFYFYDYPITHSLLGTAGWAAAFGLLIGWALRSRTAGILAGLVVASHWLADLVSHGPDLTLMGGETRFGLGLWNYPVASIVIEVGVTLAAFAWYFARTEGKRWPAIILMAVLVALQIVNWLGSEPTKMSPALPIVAMIGTAIPTALAFWTEATRRHRRAGGLAEAAAAG